MEPCLLTSSCNCASLNAVIGAVVKRAVWGMTGRFLGYTMLLAAFLQDPSMRLCFRWTTLLDRVLCSAYDVHAVD